MQHNYKDKFNENKKANQLILSSATFSNNHLKHMIGHGCDECSTFFNWYFMPGLPKSLLKGLDIVELFSTLEHFLR
jgi:hypothetical protein